MNELTIRPERLERLRGICLALPGATEKEAWGDPTWRVRDKIFAMQKGNYDGARPSVWMKAGDGVQEVLVSSDPDSFFVAQLLQPSARMSSTPLEQSTPARDGSPAQRRAGAGVRAEP